MIAPVIPGLTDHELPAIVTAAAKAGARFAHFLVLRLPFGVAHLFEQWLTQHFPDRKEKVFAQIRAVRGGQLDDARFGLRMTGEGPFAHQLAKLFEVTSRKAGIPDETLPLSTAAFRRPSGNQLSLNL